MESQFARNEQDYELFNLAHELNFCGIDTLTDAISQKIHSHTPTDSYSVTLGSSDASSAIEMDSSKSDASSFSESVDNFRSPQRTSPVPLLYKPTQAESPLSAVTALAVLNRLRAQTADTGGRSFHRFMLLAKVLDAFSSSKLIAFMWI